MARYHTDHQTRSISHRTGCGREKRSAGFAAYGTYAGCHLTLLEKGLTVSWQWVARMTLLSVHEKRSPVQEIILSSFLLISFMSQAQDYEVYVSSRGENAVKILRLWRLSRLLVAPGEGGLNGTEDILSS